MARRHRNLARRGIGLLDTLRTVLYALAVALVIRVFLFQPFWIPSSSMKDTLLVGDYVIITKFAYGFTRFSCPFDLCPIKDRILAREPRRGDVVVFRHPAGRDDLVKRVIGLPGDTVQMRGGRLYIDGAEVPQVPAGTFTETFAAQGPEDDMPRCDNGPVGEGGACEKQRFVETLPDGARHDILRIVHGGYANDTPVFTVPKGELFVMGDNRDNSADSRFARDAGGVGFLPEDHLIGRADLVLFSSAGRSLLYFWTWRAGRFLHIVR